MKLDRFTILIVEDDLALQEAVKMKLERSGFGVVATASAEKGIEELNAKQVDFIWLDMMLPGMNGLQFLEQIRQVGAYKEIPVMIVSAYTSDENVEKAYSLNILNFITKLDHSIKDIVSEVSVYFENKVLTAS